MSRIDWNLIPALDALLAERNVSRAARRLGVSQSAASGALARLRRHFGDELLLRNGNSYELTPLAKRLVPLTDALTTSTKSLLATTQVFDPSTASREFVVAATEYGQWVIGPELVRRASSLAPGVRIRFQWPTTAAPRDLDWLGSVDGWIGPRDVFTDVPSTGLLQDRWVCVVDARNPDVAAALPLGEVGNHAWVVPTVPRDREAPWKRRLLTHGIDLQIAVTTESFSAVPFLVAGSSRIGLVQHALLRRFEGALDLRVVECPWEMLPLSFTLWWHGNRENDPAHAWLRDQFAQSISTLTDGPT